MIKHIHEYIMNSNLIKFHDTITLNVVEIRDHIASIVSINLKKHGGCVHICL